MSVIRDIAINDNEIMNVFPDVFARYVHYIVTFRHANARGQPSAKNVKKKKKRVIFGLSPGRPEP